MSKTGRKKKQKRGGVPLGLYILPEIFGAFSRFVEGSEPRTSKTAVIEMLLKRFLEAEGYWPPPDTKKQGTS